MAIAATASMQTGAIKTTMDEYIVTVRMAVITDRATAMDVFTTRDEHMSETCGEICGSFLHQSMQNCPIGAFAPERAMPSGGVRDASG